MTWLAETLAAVRQRARRAQSPDAAPAIEPDSVPPSAESAHERLIEAVISVRDLLDPDTVISRRIGAALQDSGVHELVPIGERFDPVRHHLVFTTATAVPAEDGLICEVQRVGYSQGPRTIRVPEVVVYKLSSTS